MLLDDVDVGYDRSAIPDSRSQIGFVDRWAPRLLSVLRVIAGFLFVAHGTQKLFGVPSTEPPPPFDPGSLMGVAGLLETTGGALLLFGLLTRPVAFVLSGEMAVAYFLRHAPRDFWPALNGGELAVLYCFIFLFFSVAGPGPWSVDALLRGRRQPHLGSHEQHRRWAATH
jgi:putative oxidoreductase